MKLSGWIFNCIQWTSGAAWCPLFEDGEVMLHDKLDVEPEQNDVPVFHHVFLALGADQAFFFGGGHAAAGHQVVVGDYLGADEAVR